MAFLEDCDDGRTAVYPVGGMQKTIQTEILQSERCPATVGTYIYLIAVILCSSHKTRHPHRKVCKAGEKITSFFYLAPKSSQQNTIHHHRITRVGKSSATKPLVREQQPQTPASCVGAKPSADQPHSLHENEKGTSLIKPQLDASLFPQARWWDADHQLSSK